MDQYLPLLVMFVLALAFAGLSFVASTLLGQRKRPTLAKVAPYECGIVPDREPAERFPVRFYLVAMLFIILDIEIIFLFPWAAVLLDAEGGLGAFGLWEMALFGAAVFVSFIYLLGRGALNWGPSKRTPVGDVRLATAAGRSTESTVRRVGHVGVREVGQTGRVPAAAGASGAGRSDPGER